MMNYRYQRMGIYDHWIKSDFEFKSLKETVAIRDKNPKEKSARDYLVQNSSIAASKFLLRDEVKKAKECAERAILFADDYFFGKWRDTARINDPNEEGLTNREFHNRYCLWLSQFESALLWGSALGDWKFLKKLGGFFPEDLLGEIDEPLARCAWYNLVGGVLSGRKESGLKQFRKTIEQAKARGKREQLLLPALDSVLAGDDASRAKAFGEYFAYFKKNEVKAPSLFGHMMVSGTFLIHYAAHLKKPVEVPADIEDYVARF